MFWQYSGTQYIYIGSTVTNTILLSSILSLVQCCGVYFCACPQFEGVEIALDDRVGIFITMNPGYAGRTELPESVKALFRPVVVIVPDLQQICEIMLFSEGFLLAKVGSCLIHGICYFPLTFLVFSYMYILVHVYDQGGLQCEMYQLRCGHCSHDRENGETSFSLVDVAHAQYLVYRIWP